MKKFHKLIAYTLIFIMVTSTMSSLFTIKSEAATFMGALPTGYHYTGNEIGPVAVANNTANPGVAPGDTSTYVITARGSETCFHVQKWGTIGVGGGMTESIGSFYWPAEQVIGGVAVSEDVKSLNDSNPYGDANYVGTGQKWWDVRFFKQESTSTYCLSNVDNGKYYPYIMYHLRDGYNASTNFVPNTGVTKILNSNYTTANIPILATRMFYNNEVGDGYRSDSGCGIPGHPNSWHACSKGIFFAETSHTAYWAKYRSIAPNTYTIKFNGNGGAGTTADLGMTYDVSKNLTANGFTRTGYTFTGWNTAANGTGTAYSNKQSVSNLTSTDGGTINLYAQWKPNTYTLSYTLNNGTQGANHPNSATYDVQFNVSTPSRTGYQFNGWTISGMDTNTHTIGNRTNSSTVVNNEKATAFKNLRATAGTVTFNAQWTANQYSVVYNKNKPANASSNVGGTMNDTVVNYDQTFNLAQNAYTLTGWEFTGWNTKSDGTGTSYTNGQQVSNLTTVNNGKYNLYAQWKQLSYYVNIYPNTPSDSTSTIKNEGPTGYTWSGDHYTKEFIYDDTPLDSPDKIFSLTGWTIDTSGYYTTGGTNGEASGDKKITGSKNLTTTGGGTVNLYVKWTKNKYTIEYDGNNTDYNIYGDETTQNFTGNTPSTTAEYDSKVDIAKNGFKKTGYIFKEWNTKSDGKGDSYEENKTYDKPNFTAVNNGRVTLYAIWEPVVYNIKFNSNDDALGNWNVTDEYYQNNIRFDEYINLDENRFTRNAPITLSNGVVINTGYTFRGWGRNVPKFDIDYSDKQKVRNLTTVDNDTVNLYAMWQRGLSLTFNMNGGYYNGSPDNVVLSSTIYDSYYGYTFNIAGGTTGEVAGLQTTQVNSIDAFGTYDANGINSKYKMSGNNGVEYRFLGWSTNKNAKEPDENLSVYLPSTGLYNIYNNTTLYAIWEPVLTVDFNLSRTLGQLSYEDGTYPKDSIRGLTSSSGNNTVDVILRPGEQGQYTINTYNNSTVRVAFDTKITDIYTHDGIWKDGLNPSTSEDLVENQGHGLDRQFTTNNVQSIRKFYLPQYLGTENSYASSIGVSRYNVLWSVYQDSYYYKTLNGGKEEIEIKGTIYLSKNKEPGSPIETVFDDLRTKLKIRLK